LKEIASAGNRFGHNFGAYLNKKTLINKAAIKNQISGRATSFFPVLRVQNPEQSRQQLLILANQGLPPYRNAAPRPKITFKYISVNNFGLRIYILVFI